MDSDRDELQALLSQGQSEGDTAPEGSEQPIGGAMVVVTYKSFAELDEKLNAYAVGDFYPVLALPPLPGESTPAVIMRAPRQYPKDEKLPETTCSIAGGPFDGCILDMRTAEALWGAQLLGDPKSGRAKATAAGHKATTATWREVVERVWPEVTNPVDERKFTWLPKREDEWMQELKELGG